MNYSLHRKSKIAFIVLMCVGFITGIKTIQAQTITTIYSGGGLYHLTGSPQPGGFAITFAVQNTNAYPINITNVGNYMRANKTERWTLLYKPTPLSGLPGAITAANGWTAIDSALVSSTTTGIQNVISGMSFMIPANTTYRMALTTRHVPALAGDSLYIYGDVTPSMVTPNIFTNNGVSILAGNNATSNGYVGQTNGAVFYTPYFFYGSITFAMATNCSTYTYPSVVTATKTLDTVCSGGSAGLNISTVIPSLGNQTYQWQYATAATGPWTNLGAAQTTSAYTANNITNSYYYRVLINCGATVKATSNNVFIFARPNVVPSASITANPGNVICAGTPVTFTASIANGGNAPSYQWKLNGNNVGSNTNTYLNANLQNNDQVQVVLTSNAVCPNPASPASNTITMTVNPLLNPMVTLTATPTTNQICSGTPIAFLATPSNGGTPVYQWQLNGNNVGTNSTTYNNNTLANNDEVRVIMTSTVNCKSKPGDTSNVLTYYVSQSVTPEVTITSNAPGNTVCKNVPVMFTASYTHGGSNQNLHWKVNGIPVGANNTVFYSSTLNNGDIVSCELVSDAMCRTKNLDTSNLIQMTVIDNPAPVITKNSNVLSTTNYAAYQWWTNGVLIGGATNQTYTVTQPGNYMVEVTDNSGCKGQSQVLWVPYILSVKNTANASTYHCYPNPTHDHLFIEGPEKVNAEVINTVGQVVLKVNDTKQISLAQLNSGVYLVQLKDKSGTIVHQAKVVKSH